MFGELVRRRFWPFDQSRKAGSHGGIEGVAMRPLITTFIVAFVLGSGTFLRAQNEKTREMTPDEARSQAVLEHHQNQKRAKPGAIRWTWALA